MRFSAETRGLYATKNTKEHKAFVTSVSFVAKKYCGTRAATFQLFNISTFQPAAAAAAARSLPDFEGEYALAACPAPGANPDYPHGVAFGGAGPCRRAGPRAKCALRATGARSCARATAAQIPAMPPPTTHASASRARRATTGAAPRALSSAVGFDLSLIPIFPP